MMIAKELIEILRCPETMASLSLLAEEKLAALNELIVAGGVMTTGGREVDSKIEAALITEDGARIYRVEDQIPIMLVDEAILTAKLKGFGSSE